MPKCMFCDKTTDTNFEYFTIEVCKRCHAQLGLDKLTKADAPSDGFMRSLVDEDEEVYVDALNVYASQFPRIHAVALFGIFFANLDDEEMDDMFIYSLIIAARAIWLFGSNRKKKKLESRKIHALHVLGNLVDVAMMCSITDENWDSELDEDLNQSRIGRIIDHSVIAILRDLNGYDDGTLHEYITETIDLIRSSEMIG